jgi:hypothetical protein
MENERSPAQADAGHKPLPAEFCKKERRLDLQY